jgi:L-lysine exporter family protein LysE/ArgO
LSGDGHGMTEVILHGLTLALGLILPLGAQNVFIFNQGMLHKRFYKVMPAIITASLCDTILILSAVLGVSVLVLNFVWLKSVLLLLGTLFLIYVGLQIWKSKGHHESETMNSFSYNKQISFAATVSLLNPHAIIDTVGVIGTSSIAYSGLEKWIFATTCIVVSWIWFFGLALVGKMIGHLDQQDLITRKLNKVSAILIWLVAVFLSIQFIKEI